MQVHVLNENGHRCKVAVSIKREREVVTRGNLQKYFYPRKKFFPQSFGSARTISVNQPEKQMRMNDKSMSALLERCKLVDSNKWMVAKPIYVRRFPFYGFGISFRRRTKECDELEKKYIELFNGDTNMNKTTITKQNTYVVTLNADGSLFSVTPKGKRHTKPNGYTSYEISGHGMTFAEASQLAREKHGSARTAK